MLSIGFAIVFIAFPIRGQQHRMFRVPLNRLDADDRVALARLLSDASAEYTFSDRNESPLLWRIGCRLGVTNGDGGGNGSDLADCEVGGDAVSSSFADRGIIFGVLCGQSD